MNVLIIDNDSEDTDIFREALMEVMPSAICTVTNRCPDIELILSSLPEQFIFLSAHMAPENSLQCAAAISAIVNTYHTTIIIHTGSLSPVEESQFLSFGAYEILLKSNSFIQLKENLNRILTTREFKLK